MGEYRTGERRERDKKVERLGEREGGSGRDRGRERELEERES